MMLYQFFGLSMAICMLVTSAVISTEKNVMTTYASAISVILSLLTILHPTWWMLILSSYFSYATLYSISYEKQDKELIRVIINSTLGDGIKAFQKTIWGLSITVVGIITWYIGLTLPKESTLPAIVYPIMVLTLISLSLTYGRVIGNTIIWLIEAIARPIIWLIEAIARPFNWAIDKLKDWLIPRT